MRPVGKTTRKHRRQQKAGKPRHKLVGGRTGGLAHHQRKNFNRGKAAKAQGKARNDITRMGNPASASAMAFRVKKK